MSDRPETVYDITPMADQSQWRKHRDAWKPWLDALPQNTVITTIRGTTWEKMTTPTPGFKHSCQLWQSGFCVVSTIVLLQLGNGFRIRD